MAGLSLIYGVCFLLFPIVIRAEKDEQQKDLQRELLASLLVGRLLKQEVALDAEEVGIRGKALSGKDETDFRVEEGDLIFNGPPSSSASSAYDERGHHDERVVVHDADLDDDVDEDDGEKPEVELKRRPKAVKWAEGIVPFTIDEAITDERLKNLLLAMKQLEDAVNSDHDNRPCLHFWPIIYDPRDPGDPSNPGDPRGKESEFRRPANFVYVRPVEKGCSSSVGVQGGTQFLNLGPRCWQVGKIQHELLHTVGLWHEQSRGDRYQYIDIKWKNIKEGKQHDFLVYTDAKADHQGLPYDYGSIMHYGPYYFAKDRRSPTIVPRKRDVEIGQRLTPSKTDVKKLKLLYKCGQN